MTQASQRPGTGVDQYLGLPYRVTLVQDGKDKKAPWLAAVEELPDCTNRGKTATEATAGIQEAMTTWLTRAIEEGREIPEPKPAVEPKTASGRLLLRMPRTLHSELIGLAERESVSLNQFITDVLASAAGWRGEQGAGAKAKTVSTSQKPGAEGLVAEPSGTARRRSGSRLVTAALIGNFVVVAFAGIVAILVLIAAWD